MVNCRLILTYITPNYFNADNILLPFWYFQVCPGISLEVCHYLIRTTRPKRVVRSVPSLALDLVYSLEVYTLDISDWFLGQYSLGIIEAQASDTSIRLLDQYFTSSGKAQALGTPDHQFGPIFGLQISNSTLHFRSQQYYQMRHLSYCCTDLGSPAPSGIIECRQIRT